MTTTDFTETLTHDLERIAKTHRIRWNPSGDIPFKRKHLLSVGSDGKTPKGEKRGYLTGILYMAPARSAGVGNLCPMASLGCEAGCLDTAGRGAGDNVVANGIHEARKRKARFFMQEREAFFWNLVKDIEALIRAAIRRDLIPAVRLNGTQDIKWESQRFGPERKTIFERFPDVQFYDYTKWPADKRAEIPANFHLTHSRAEDNESMVMDALKFGRSVAVVFSTPAKRGKRPGGKLPTTWNNHRVIDGDESDLRFLDDAGVVVGLRAKGDAKHDTSGFVVQV
jgi:hypothetical protein